MARRRYLGKGGGSSEKTSGFADRIAAATRREVAIDDGKAAPAVLNQRLTRYQRRTANLPSGATPLTTEERTNIVIDLRDHEQAEER